MDLMPDREHDLLVEAYGLERLALRSVIVAPSRGYRKAPGRLR